MMNGEVPLKAIVMPEFQYLYLDASLSVCNSKLGFTSLRLNRHQLDLVHGKELVR